MGISSYLPKIGVLGFRRAIAHHGRLRFKRALQRQRLADAVREGQASVMRKRA